MIDESFSLGRYSFGGLLPKCTGLRVNVTTCDFIYPYTQRLLRALSSIKSAPVAVFLEGHIFTALMGDNLFPLSYHEPLP